MDGLDEGTGEVWGRGIVGAKRYGGAYNKHERYQH